MPSREHELYTDVFKNKPALASEPLEQVGKIKIPPNRRVRLRSPDLNQSVPTEYRADAVVEVAGRDGVAIVVEIQRTKDKKKRWTWPVYLTTLRNRLKKPTALLVLCPDERTADWSREPIEMGHPGWQLTPLALGSGDVSPSPELDVLIARSDPDDIRAAETVHRAFKALLKEGKENAWMYLDYARKHLSEAALMKLEELMKEDESTYESEWARKINAQGKAEGLAEGKAESVLDLLDMRHIEVPDETRETILGCTDLSQLDVWFERAVTAETVDDLFT